MKYYLDWLFKDLHGRNGKYVISEAPNPPLIIFMVSIILAVVVYPGFWQTSFAVIAYMALVYWGYLEIRSGRSRFRKFLGCAGILAVAGALLLRLGL
jgi:uncharacterized membrane protein